MLLHASAFCGCTNLTSFTVLGKTNSVSHTIDKGMVHQKHTHHTHGKPRKHSEWNMENFVLYF